MLSAVLLALALPCYAAAAPSPVTGAEGFSEPSLDARATAGTKNVIIQMFQWTWDSIAAECTSFIGPAGYGYIQGKLLPTV